MIICMRFASLPDGLGEEVEPVESAVDELPVLPPELDESRAD